MDTLRRDLRYGLRRLWRSPGFTSTVLLTLMVGIGMNSAMFSVVNAVVLKPLPYDEAERIFMVWGRFPLLGFERLPISEPELLDFKEQSRLFDQVAAWTTAMVTLDVDAEPVKVTASRATAELFTVLRRTAAQGRTFTAEEDGPLGQRVAVLSHRLWQRRFGADPGLIGQSLTFDGENHLVVGIMSADFRFPEDTEVWLPLALDPADLEPRDRHYLRVAARLAPGTTPQQAAAEVKALAYRLQNRFPETYPSYSAYGLYLMPLRQYLVGDVRAAFLVLLATVGFVLLIACTNVANLLLVRAQTRTREISVRRALGISRWGLLRQFLVESLLLTTAGGALGLGMAYGGLRLFVAIHRENIPRAHTIGIDGQVLGFTVVLMLLTGIVLALIVAWRSLRVRLSEALKEGSGQSGSGVSQQATRSLLVISEVALALMLLIGAGLTINSFERLRRIDTGFQEEGLLSIRLSLRELSYPEDRKVIGFYRELREQARNLAGVEAAALVDEPPFSLNTFSTGFSIEGRPFSHGPGEIPPVAILLSVSPDYFQTMGIPVLQGRGFTDQDHEAAMPVVILDAATARRFWKGENPIGGRLKLDGTPHTIVGIVGRIKDSRLQADDEEHLYLPYPQRPKHDMALMLRSADPGSTVAAVRGVVRELDSGVPLFDIQEMEQRVAASMSNERLSMSLFSLFTAVALVLAAIGLYGVVAYSVGQRTREIGIRLALGARTSQVFVMVIGHGLVLTLIGVAVGVASALAVSQLMSSLLFEISPNDPATFAAAAVLLLSVGLAASFFPARQASRVAPAIALRSE